MSLPYNHDLIQRARTLRKNATPQERHLWYAFLKDYPVRFQRQKTVDSFVVDFYCHAAKLAIEVDGSQHYTEQGTAYDEDRSLVLSRYGLTILRFSNREINTQFSEVCEKIHQTVQSALRDNTP
ncbi:MAG: endonuclease domain-containing protein [Clostridia bacterium]|nr:endonuclease domain-containing protein [Clostridia bacterium]